MIDDSEKVIGTKPLSKVSIKINQKENENINGLNYSINNTV